MTRMDAQGIIAPDANGFIASAKCACGRVIALARAAGPKRFGGVEIDMVVLARHLQLLLDEVL